ncbi:MAG: hypothetical protein KBH73_08175 [Syntrophobacterales bacterium]|nr:hypothetical protein [Syntrophobacterales bacterium]
MRAALAERVIGEKAMEEQAIGHDSCIFDRIVEVDGPDDGTAFIVIDTVMTLLVYLAPVAAFGCLVAPVVARLLGMPISH